MNLNRLKNGIVASSLILGGLITQTQVAVAQTLSKEDDSQRTEKMIVNQTSSNIEDVKKIFMTPNFLSDEEMKEFKILRFNAKNNDTRESCKKQILRIYNNGDDVQTAILTLAILDPMRAGNLGKRASNEIDKNPIYKYQFSDIIKILKLDQKNAQLDQKNAQLEKLIDALEDMERLFEKNQNK